MYEHIAVSEVKDGVCSIALNRPDKKNALSIALRDELSDALDALAANEELKVVVLTGEGSVFSAGFDLGEFQQAIGDAEFMKTLWASSDRYHQTCMFFPLPMIAALNGPAIAGGCDLATMCDIRIATPETYFAHPEIAFGDVMYAPLRDLVGGAMARDLVLTGRKVGAEEAERIGLVSKVTPRESLEEAVAEYAGMICQAPRPNLLNTKAKIIARAGYEKKGTLEI